MKKSLLVIGLVMVYVTVWSQTVTNADCYEKDQQAVITYSLDKEANIDLEVSVNGQEFEPIDRTHLEGDAGVNVSKGKSKKIVWDVLSERSALVGDVQFRVVPSESYNNYNKRIRKENYYKSGYPALCTSYFKTNGTFSLSFADIGIAAGLRDKKGIAPFYFGAATVRYKYFELTLVSFAVELSSISSKDVTEIYWRPQARFIIPMTEDWAFVFSAGPSYDILDAWGISDNRRWSVAATARVRYGIQLAQVEFYAGYEHSAIVAGAALSLKWGK